MAVAEARAAWQRTANRCFVQEDAKRAPKLACYPSSDASSKQIYPGPGSAADGQHYSVPGFVPINRNPSYTYLPPDSRWWLQLQPIYGYQRVLANEQLNTQEAKMETFKAGLRSLKAKPSGFQLENDDSGVLVTENSTPVSAIKGPGHKSKPSLDIHSRICSNCIKKDRGVKKQELKIVYMKNVQEPPKVKDGEESYESIEMDPVGCTGFKQSIELCFESGSPWIEDEKSEPQLDPVGCTGFKNSNELSFESGFPWIDNEKSEPWWRTAGRNELASFVAQRSLDLVDNCDLPQPRNTHIKRGPYAYDRCIDHDGILTSSVIRKPQTTGHSNTTVDTSGSGTLGGVYRSNCSVEGNSESGIDRLIRNNTRHNEPAETQISEKDLSKAQLLEALMHSQTRAREAEKAAKQTYEEKEHVTKLFFKQASHLFAYKQWFQLLQLENLYFHIKNNKNYPISARFPVVLPCVPLKTRKIRKNWHEAGKGKRGKQGRSRCNINKYALIFALGLSLVGAGFFLGWTVGWVVLAF